MPPDPAGQLAANVAAWNERARFWRGLGLPEPDRVRDVISQLGCPAGSLVLDLGCGAGRWSVALALAGYRLRGVDPSPNMVAEATGRAREQGLGEEQAAFQVGHAEHILAPDAAFDGVICFSVLDFVPAPGAALREIWRIVRPEGRLVLSVLGAYSPVKREYWRRFLPGDARGEAYHIGNHILPWEVGALLGALGWRLVAQQPTFGPAASGAPNAYTLEDAQRFADPIIQQTIATGWTLVAQKPAMEEQSPSVPSPEQRS